MVLPATVLENGWATHRNGCTCRPCREALKGRPVLKTPSWVWLIGEAQGRIVEKKSTESIRQANRRIRRQKTEKRTVADLLTAIRGDRNDRIVLAMHGKRTRNKAAK